MLRLHQLAVFAMTKALDLQLWMKPTGRLKKVSQTSDKISVSLDINRTKYSTEIFNFIFPAAEFPWTTAVLVDKATAERENISAYQCGGSLITPNVVLTVAHCITDANRQSLIIRAGEWDSRTEHEFFKHQDREVKEIIIHENYSPDTVVNDIALLILREPVQITENVNTVCLPEQDQNFDYSDCYVAGWGQLLWGKAELESILKLIDLRVVPSKECQEKLSTTRLGRHFMYVNVVHQFLHILV